MTIEAMKLALEYLEESHNYLGSLNHSKPIAALRTAIAEAEKTEPIAWMYPDDYERMLTSETFCTVYSVECGSPTQGRVA